MWQSILTQIRILGNNSGCHQLPERSFFYKGKQFPVCARCTGVFFGQLISIIIIFKKNIPICLSILGIGLMGIDWGLQSLKIKESNNIRRLITGFLGGFGLFNLYIELFKKLLHLIKIKS